MHAEGKVLFPYLQGLGLSIFEETQFYLQDELLRCLRIDGTHDDNGIIIDDGNNGHLPILGETARNIGLNSTIPEYDLLEGGDLFEASHPTIEGETLPEFDIAKDSIPMVSSDESAITAEPIAVTAEYQHLQSDVFYSCESELLDNTVLEELLSDLPGIEFQEQKEKEQIVHDNGLLVELPIQKSISSDCLDMNEWTSGVHTCPDFFNYPEMNLGDAIRMRRAYSEGDIKTLGTNLNVMKNNIIHFPIEHVLNIEKHKIEERREKLSRYMKKKAKRNFGRKIKYACRKALADSQPRVRGRFAKTEECCESSK